MQEDFKSLKPEQLEALKILLGKSDTAESSEFADWFDGKRLMRLPSVNICFARKNGNVFMADFMIWMVRLKMKLSEKKF